MIIRQVIILSSLLFGENSPKNPKQQLNKMLKWCVERWCDSKIFIFLCTISEFVFFVGCLTLFFLPPGPFSPVVLRPGLVGDGDQVRSQILTEHCWFLQRVQGSLCRIGLPWEQSLLFSWETDDVFDWSVMTHIRLNDIPSLWPSS